MWKEEPGLFAVGMPKASEATSAAEPAPWSQREKGGARRLRPYRDVRSGFEPWRRLALLAWAAREDGGTLN